MKDIIYVTGCSWSAGAELADGEFFTGWPGIVDLASDYQKSFAREWFLTKRNPQMDQYLDREGLDWVFKQEAREKALAWPSRLAELSGHTVINAAVNGCGQEEAVMAARKDILMLKSQGHKVRVISQLTSPYRWVWPQTYTVGHNRPWASILVSAQYRTGSPEDRAQKAYMSWPKDLCELKWLNDLANLIDLCRSHEIPIGLMQAWSWEFDPSQFGPLWDYISPYMILGETIDQRFGHNQRLPGGHPTQQTHNDLAQWINETLL